MGRRMLKTPQPQLRGVCADCGCYNVAADDACDGFELVMMGFALLGPAGAVYFPAAASCQLVVDCVWALPTYHSGHLILKILSKLRDHHARRCSDQLVDHLPPKLRCLGS